MEKYSTDQLILLQDAIDLMLNKYDLIFTDFSDVMEIRKDVEMELRFRREG